MQPYQIHLLYFYYGKIKSLQLIGTYYYKLGLSVTGICYGILEANREMNVIKELLNERNYI